MDVLNILAPVFLLVLIGALLRSRRFASNEFFRGTNRLVYWIAIPAQLLNESASARIEGGAALRVASVLLAGMAGCLGIGYLAARLLRLARPETGAFLQGTFRGNLVYVGLPVVLLASTTPGQAADTTLRALAVLAIAALVPIYNLAAVAALLPASLQPGMSSSMRPRRFLLALATNPLVLSCLGGLAVSLAGWQLPAVISRTLATVGQMATPLALLGLGASLTVTSLRRRAVPAVAAALIKVGVAPLVGYLVGSWLNLQVSEMRMALIYLATPTATASFVMAQQMGADEELAGSIIAASTLLAFPALAIALLIR